MLRTLARSFVASLPPALRYRAFIASASIASHLVENERARRQIIQTLPPPLRVAFGPFEGMRYLRVSASSALIPKILGNYEMELHGPIERLIGDRPDLVLNVGAAEGYYAVGFARRLPEATIYAFDTDPYARYLTHALARKNALDARVHVRGTCDPATLEQLLRDAKRPALFVDIEGGEVALLDLTLVPSLRHTRILVETHRHAAPHLLALLRKRFESSHVIERLEDLPRTRRDLPHLAHLDDRLFAHAIQEWRIDPFGWLALWPKPL